MSHLTSAAKNRRIRRKYDGFSSSYDRWDSEHRSVARQRRALVRGLGGRILEVGIGTGLNLEYYQPGTDVTGVDVSRGMLRQAATRAQSLPNHRVKLARASAARLPFLDDTFDVVVGTFVFCSFGDPSRAATEIKRVLRPGGRLVRLGYHTPMVTRILREAGFVIRARREWETDDRPIGRIVAVKPAVRTSRPARKHRHSP